MTKLNIDLEQLYRNYQQVSKRINQKEIRQEYLEQEIRVNKDETKKLQKAAETILNVIEEQKLINVNLDMVWLNKSHTGNTNTIEYWMINKEYYKRSKTYPEAKWQKGNFYVIDTDEAMNRLHAYLRVNNIIYWGGLTDDIDYFESGDRFYLYRRVGLGDDVKYKEFKIEEDIEDKTLINALEVSRIIIFRRKEMHLI